MKTENNLKSLIDKIELGYSELPYNGKKYGVSRKDFNSGNSIKVYAEELGGNDFISFNYYETDEAFLKPCEMPEEKVMKFLRSI